MKRQSKRYKSSSEGKYLTKLKAKKKKQHKRSSSEEKSSEKSSEDERDKKQKICQGLSNI